MADRLPAAVAPGDTLALDVHVVSDLRVAVDDARVTARLEWPGGRHEWRWGGEVPADSCVRVGTLQAVVPEAAGPLRLGLERFPVQVEHGCGAHELVERLPPFGLDPLHDAQPLAATMAGASCLAVECRPSSIEFRLRTGYLDKQAGAPQ